MSERNAFVQLFLARMREFVREPEVVFWVFLFPVLLAVGLGVAFRNRPPDAVAVGVVDGAGADVAMSALTKEKGFEAKRLDASAAELELVLGKVSIVVLPTEPREYRFDPTRPESVLARARVDDALQRAAGRTDPVATKDALVTEPGARYIDFVIPGLLGMNIMSGGLWGIGFALVEMRSRKLLKRLSATPMRRGQFLAAMMASRMVLVFGEMALLLALGWVAYDMVVRGSLWQVAVLCLLGAAVFAGIGLLVASRAKKTEVVAGLMNLVMLPMFVFSGVFFSSERFPEVMQPFVKALPLTALNDALRAVVLEGKGIGQQGPQIAVLVAWGVVCFGAALKSFRWT